MTRNQCLDCCEQDGHGNGYPNYGEVFAQGKKWKRLLTVYYCPSVAGSGLRCLLCNFHGSSEQIITDVTSGQCNTYVQCRYVVVVYGNIF